MKNKLDYNYIATGEEHLPQHNPNIFRCNSSSIANFFDYTPSWYQEKFNNDKAFLGSTSSVAGTCIHFLCEQFSNNGVITDTDREEVYEYIDLQASEDVDPNEVRSMIKPMWKVAKEYLLANPSSLNEPFIYHELANNLIVGGSIDSLVDLTDPGAKYNSLDELPRDHLYKIIDYKTTSAKTRVSKWSKSYKFQQLSYAWVLAKYGIKVTQIELLFISKQQGGGTGKSGKPLKVYPSEVYNLTEEVTSSSLDLIEGIIYMIVDSVKLFNDKPELRHIIAQDNRWKTMQPQNKYNFTQQEMDI